MGYFHGKEGSLKIDDESHPMQSWKATPKTAAVETTDSASGGWQTMLPGGGIKSMDGSFKCQFDKLKDPHAAPINFWGSEDLVPLELIAHNGFRYSFLAFLETMDITVEVKNEEAVSFEIPFKSSGPVTITRGTPPPEGP